MMTPMDVGGSAALPHLVLIIRICRRIRSFLRPPFYLFYSAFVALFLL